jgi:hypothetical protein
MKETLKNIVGKTIQGVVVKTQEAKPRRGSMALFPAFTDETYLEIWTDGGGGLHPAGGLDRGDLEEILKYDGAASILVQKCWEHTETRIQLNEYHSPES